MEWSGWIGLAIGIGVSTPGRTSLEHDDSRKVRIVATELVSNEGVESGKNELI
jgi:hypothetical protein